MWNCPQPILPRCTDRPPCALRRGHLKYSGYASVVTAAPGCGTESGQRTYTARAVDAN
jgi:hypothetical protein